MCSLLGFAANNISESYDAKIFAVSTLLSSYLIYNSVKVCLFGGVMLQCLLDQILRYKLLCMVSYGKNHWQ